MVMVSGVMFLSRQSRPPSQAAHTFLLVEGFGRVLCQSHLSLQHHMKLRLDTPITVLLLEQQTHKTVTFQMVTKPSIEWPYGDQKRGVLLVVLLLELQTHQTVIYRMVSFGRPSGDRKRGIFLVAILADQPQSCPQCSVQRMVISVLAMIGYPHSFENYSFSIVYIRCEELRNNCHFSSFMFCLCCWQLGLLWFSGIIVAS
uniref:Uncharacterized protein n=1 Tax=Arundo donax TaxID=35708 RepID=A0A0A9BZ37_ARUDO